MALGFAPQTGADLTVIKNTGLNFISGQFSNLAQGQKVALIYQNRIFEFIANYYGGKGNTSSSSGRGVAFIHGATTPATPCLWEEPGSYTVHGRIPD